MIRIRWFRYVPISRIDAFLACGWHLAEALPVHHDDYSVIMEWLCTCRGPVEPLR